MFIQNDPDKRALPEALQRLRARIASVERQGAEAAVTEARRAVETTTDQRLRLERELADQKRVASRFTADFEAYKDLEADLAALDEMQREAQSERVAIETQAVDGYPQIEIIEPAHPPRDPVRPLYGRDFGISVAAAGGAGLLTVLGLLLLDAARRPRRGLPMTGVRIWGDDAGGRPAGGPQLPPYAPPGQLGQASGGALPGRGPALLGALPDATARQLMGGEVEALWELADDAERQIMGLLLCGLDLPEILLLTTEDFDLRESEVRVPTDARRILLPPVLADLFKDAHPLPAWRSPEEAAETARRIPLLAVDAGLAHAAEVTPDVLRHTYLAFLVRQGARLTELHRIAGRLDSATVQRYAPLSPTGASRPIGQVDLAYPLLA
jgi:polysaccharide biosynthesis transport protein